MIYLNKIGKISFENDKFSSITTDGKYIYLTMPQTKEVFVLNRQYKLIDKIKTEYSINHLTFVPKEMIFLGIEADNNNEIMIYDIDLVWTGKIPLSEKLYSNEKIVSIDYNDKIDKIFIGYESHVSVLDYYNNLNTMIIAKYENKVNTGFYSKNNIILSTFYHKDNQFLEIIKSGKKVYSSIVNENYEIKDIFIEYKNNICYLYILTSKNQNSFYLQILSIPQNKNYSRKKTNISQNKFTCYKEKLYSRNRLIKSIERIENRLSCIIEVEAKKIEKCLNRCTCINDILMMNKSLNETIINITHLEIILYEILRKRNM